MNQSERVDQLLKNLALAQSQFYELKKSGLNKFFKTQDGGYHQFSTLNDIFDSCKDSLRKHEIVIYYQCIYEDGMNFLETRIVDLKSGQWMRSISALGSSNVNPQQIGSAITYFRRYHIQALLNLEADFEDDGNQASNRNTNLTHNTKPKIVKIDFEYSGAPYRIFDWEGKKIKEYTDIRTWGMEIKKTSIINKSQSNNVSEIERIKKDVNDDQELTEKAKENLLNSISTIVEGDKK